MVADVSALPTDFVKTHDPKEQCSLASGLFLSRRVGARHHYQTTRLSRAGR